MLAAMAVVFSHAYEMFGAGFAAAEPVNRASGIAASGYGLCAFFFISGFLIARSLLHRADTVFFVKSRLARLYPGLLLSLVYCVLLIGPLFTELAPAEFFSRGQTGRFLIDNLIIFIPHKELGLPGVFTGNHSSLVNGSLWTLAWESLFYAGLWLVWRLGGLTCRWLVPALALILLVVYLHVLTSKTLTDVILLSGLGFSVLFSLGAAAYVLRQYQLLPWPGFFLCLLAWLWLMVYRGPVVATLNYVLFCYLVLYLAYWPSKQLLAYNKLGDFSYGLYLSHFPIMQILLHQRVAETPLALFGLTLLCTMPLAVLSWFLVEQPVLKWVKNQAAARLNVRQA